MRESTYHPIQRQGFSLIELLVVIAIIAILAAIILPVFAQAEDKSMCTVCQSNMKEISLALSMYLQDYDGAFPAQPYDDKINGGGGVANWKDPDANPNWARSLEPYIKDTHIPECPCSKKASICRANCEMEVDSISYPLSIFGNGEIFKDGISESDISDSSDTVVFQCAGQTWNSCFLAPYWNKYVKKWTSFVDTDWCEHKDGTNIIFADCHVKWRSYESLVSDLSIFDPYRGA